MKSKSSTKQNWGKQRSDRSPLQIIMSFKRHLHGLKKACSSAYIYVKFKNFNFFIFIWSNDYYEEMARCYLVWFFSKIKWLRAWEEEDNQRLTQRKKLSSWKQFYSHGQVMLKTLSFIIPLFVRCEYQTKILNTKWNSCIASQILHLGTTTYYLKKFQDIFRTKRQNSKTKKKKIQLEVVRST